MSYMYDYHTHSNNSTDGSSTIDAMCRHAMDIGLAEIAITDHFEPTLGNEHYLQYNSKKYFDEIHHARKCYGGQIKIKSGIELGHPHLFPVHSEKLIESNVYDFVLASAHKMSDNVDFGDLIYSSESLSAHCMKYLAELLALAEWNKFDCLGHLDLVNRYAANFGLRANLLDYREALEEILRIVISNGKGIEVNTSGLRQKSGECMPGLNIIMLYRQLGGEIITIGSDAHHANDVGKGICDALSILQTAGFRYVTVFYQRKPIMLKLSSRPVGYCFRKNPA